MKKKKIKIFFYIFAMDLLKKLTMLWLILAWHIGIPPRYVTAFKGLIYTCSVVACASHSWHHVCVCVSPRWKETL